MAKLVCRKPECGNTYMEKVSINEFHDYGGSLYNFLPEVVPATDVKAYKCAKCATINLATLDWGTPDVDRKIAALLMDIADGKDVKPDPKIARSRGPASGYVTSVNPEHSSDPSLQGTFVRKF